MNNCTDLAEKLKSLTTHITASPKRILTEGACTVNVKDKELQRELEKISPYAVFMTTGAIALKDNKVYMDVPVNLFQDIIKKKGAKYAPNFRFRGELKPPDICKIKELHIYSDSLPTVHVRMSCNIEKTGTPAIDEVHRMDAITKIAEFIKRTNDISRKNYMIHKKSK